MSPDAIALFVSDVCVAAFSAIISLITAGVA
jgi:hypothetical protein